MRSSIHIDNNDGVTPRHQFNAARVGTGTEHKNVSRRACSEIVIRIGAFTVDAALPVLPPKAMFGEPGFLPISRSVDRVRCLVDTGADVSIFRGDIAKRLGLDPNGGSVNDCAFEVFDGGPLSCCCCTREVYLGIGPYPIPVPVLFPVEPVKKGKTVKFQWRKDYPPENILGMEAVLDKCMLCFTFDLLFVFENRR